MGWCAAGSGRLEDIMSKYVMMLLACVFMFSCKSNCVEVKSNSKQVEKVQVHDTLHIKDSIYTEHKQYVHQKGDTVYIEHVLYKYKEKAQKGVLHLDTIINVVDTVTIYELTNGEQSRNVSPIWGAIVVIILTVLATVYVVKKKS